MCMASPSRRLLRCSQLGATDVIHHAIMMSRLMGALAPNFVSLELAWGKALFTRGPLGRTRDFEMVPGSAGNKFDNNSKGGGKGVAGKAPKTPPKLGPARGGQAGSTYLDVALGALEAVAPPRQSGGKVEGNEDVVQTAGLEAGSLAPIVLDEDSAAESAAAASPSPVDKLEKLHQVWKQIAALLGNDSPEAQAMHARWQEAGNQHQASKPMPARLQNVGRQLRAAEQKRDQVAQRIQQAKLLYGKAKYLLEKETSEHKNAEEIVAQLSRQQDELLGKSQPRRLKSSMKT